MDRPIPATDDSISTALARYYDLDLADDSADVDMYLALADASDEPILELGAGTGRICVPLAAAGHRVWALDRDSRMLGRAAALWSATTDRAEGGELHLVEADMTEATLDERFGLVFVALNSLLMVDGRAAQRAALGTMARHLAPDGRAVVDIWLPAPDDLVLYDGRLVLDWVRRDEESDEWVAKSTSARYEPAAGTADLTSFFDAWRDGDAPRRVMRRDRISFLAASELVAIAESAGLVVDALAGDYGMGPFAGDSDRLVMVCRSGSD